MDAFLNEPGEPGEPGGPGEPGEPGEPGTMEGVNAFLNEPRRLRF